MHKLKNLRTCLNKPRSRVIICIVLTLAIFLCYAARLFDWQIIQGETYREEGISSATYSVDSQAVRGEIRTSDGKGLAVNETVYNVAFSKIYLDKDKLNETILEMFDLLKTCNAKWVDNLPIKYSKGEYTFDEKNEDYESILKSLRASDYLDISVYSLPKDYIKALCDRFDIAEEDYEPSTLRDLLSVRYNMEATGYSYTNDYIFAEDITSQVAQAVSENMQGKKGIQIKNTVNRVYKNGSLAPHIVGTTGKITAEEYEEVGENYSYNDIIGKFGIELACEDELKGTSGSKMIERNSNGEVSAVVDTEKSQPGDTVFLTIDSGLQKVANQALKDNVNTAHLAANDCVAGGVVMLDVKDFSVLAAASYPTYDLKKYKDYDYYNSLVNNKATPLFNRCYNGSFAPGSVFKPAVAVAALEEGAINTNTIIVCTHNYDYYPSNVVKCMGYHGGIALNQALAVSCNYFFAETGRRLGIDLIYQYAEKFGLGKKTGVEISESKGFLAGRDSTSWVAGNTVQAAIGQSDNAFTVAQLASYVGTIANDGVRLKAHLIDKVTDYTQEKVIEQPTRTELDRLDVDPDNLKAVQEGMRSVVTSSSGTAHSVFGDYGIAVAAKTGTAENSGSDHTTFICYAPFEKPEVAVAVVIEHGASGRYSMNVAKALLDKYFYNKNYGEY